MYITFDTEVAGKIGLNAAVLLSNLSYWVKRNAANETNFHDGHYWTFNSVRAFCQLFPFWTRNVIYKTLKALEDDGYILSGCFNKEGTDRTKWYTVTKKAYDMMAECISSEGESHFSSGRNGFCPEQKTTNIQRRTSKGEQQSNTRARAHEVVPLDHPSPELLEAWRGYAEYRKSIRKAMTQRAAELTARKLEKLAPGDDAKKAAILNQSVERGWQGVFPLDEDKKKARRGGNYGAQPSTKDLYDEGMAALERMQKGEFL